MSESDQDIIKEIFGNDNVKAGKEIKLKDGLQEIRYKLWQSKKLAENIFVQ